MSRAIDLAGFGVLAGCALLLLVAGRCRSDVPSAGQLLSGLMRSRTGRYAVICGWWWLGWHLFVR
jgi:hypothetical protein